jgi:hypothetical protein
MDDGSPERRIDGVVDLVGHEDGAHGHQSAAERLGQDHDVGLHIEMVRRQESSGAIHAGLHFIKDEERARPPARLLGLPQIGWRGYLDSAFGL